MRCEYAALFCILDACALHSAVVASGCRNRVAAGTGQKTLTLPQEPDPPG